MICFASLALPYAEVSCCFTLCWILQMGEVGCSKYGWSSSYLNSAVWRFSVHPFCWDSSVALTRSDLVDPAASLLSLCGGCFHLHWTLINSTTPIWWRKGLIFARWTVYLACLSFVPEDMYPPNFVRSDRKWGQNWRPWSPLPSMMCVWSLPNVGRHF